MKFIDRNFTGKYGKNIIYTMIYFEGYLSTRNLFFNFETYLRHFTRANPDRDFNVLEGEKMVYKFNERDMDMEYPVGWFNTRSYDEKLHFIRSYGDDSKNWIEKE